MQDDGGPGPGKALSSLWGWGASLASKVEQAAVTVGREIAGTVHEAQPAVQAASRWGRGEAGSGPGLKMRVPAGGAAAAAMSASSKQLPCLTAPPARASPCSKVAAGGRAAEFRIGSLLGGVGRTAQGLLETALEAGSRCAWGPAAPALPAAVRKQQQTASPCSALLAAPPATRSSCGRAELTRRATPSLPSCSRRGGLAGEEEQPISFADQLYIYGGRSALEDLDAQSSDSARSAREAPGMLGREA